MSLLIGYIFLLWKFIYVYFFKTKFQFERAEPKNGKITEVQFANSLLVYAGFSENKRRKMIRRVKAKFPIDSDQSSVSLFFTPFCVDRLQDHYIMKAFTTFFLTKKKKNKSLLDLF